MKIEVEYNHEILGVRAIGGLSDRKTKTTILFDKDQWFAPPKFVCK